MYIDHLGINTNDMEATLQFYCGILGMRLVRTTRTPDGRRHYNVEIGGGNAFAVFDGAELPTAGERQHVNHLALPVDTPEEFDAAYQRLKDHGVSVTEIIERGYGKTFYFHDPNGIRLQIELRACWRAGRDAAYRSGLSDCRQLRQNTWHVGSFRRGGERIAQYCRGSLITHLRS